MRIKKGVRLRGLTPHMAVAVQIVGQVYMDNKIEPVITSVSDGNHSNGSLHHCGEAVDFETKSVSSPIVMDRIFRGIKANLGDEFDVVLESDHLHVEYDPK